MALIISSKLPHFSNYISPLRPFMHTRLAWDEIRRDEGSGRDLITSLARTLNYSFAITMFDQNHSYYYYYFTFVVLSEQI